MDDERLPGAREDEDDYEPDLLTLEDEEGEQHTFEVLDATDVGDVRYLAVVPYQADAAQLEGDSEMLIMRVGVEDGEEYLDVVDDEEELLSIGGVFINRLREVYDIDLEDLRGQLE